jgi:hypothetical protein
MDIDQASDQDVGPQFRRIGLGTVLGELRRVVHDLADLGVDALSAPRRSSSRRADLAHMVDRVAFVAILVDLFLGRYLAGSLIEWPR